MPIAQVVQTFVLGPRLLLSIRDYQAKRVTNSDEGTAMTTIAFQERVQVSTRGGVSCGDARIVHTTPLGTHASNTLFQFMYHYR